MNFVLSERWKASYSDTFVGVLVMSDLSNPAHHAQLDAEKAALEAHLRAQYTGFDRAQLRMLPTLQAYHSYYKRFKKSYHVQLQLESILWKGKEIPRVAGLVEAMFMAELKNHLLTSCAPPGVEEMAVVRHLQDIQSYALLLAAMAKTDLIAVYGAA